ncbi:MAG: hypothetical protein D6702_12735 [Planctomycetota bacterium]|nr:MAG: hypothetical protein D6702_12735 [Planctomycetota bacterium]
MHHIETGQRVGRFQITGFLGRGAFARVYAAEGQEGSPVAIKVGDESGGGRFVPRFVEVTSERDPERISPDEAPAEALFLDPTAGARAEVLDPNEVDRLLLAEAGQLRAAQGRGVVGLLDTIEVGGRPALVLELLSGATVRERMRSLEGIKLRWILRVVQTLERQIEEGNWRCHGDIKPENLFITDQDEVRLLDPAPSLGRSDLMVATPSYNPFLRRDGKGDAQAVAILLYELLCCSLPFSHTPWEFAGCDERAWSEDERELSRSYFLSYPRPRDVNPHAPRELEHAIYHALCDECYGIRELRKDLEDFLLI